jgi:inhibitor of cysteine peptidase
MDMTLADNGSTVAAKVGERIELRLNENPGTGFRWVLLPTTAVMIEADRMASVGASPGQAGQRWLTLKTEEAGEHLVRLRCERSWEGAATAVATFQFKLQAH